MKFKQMMATLVLAALAASTMAVVIAQAAPRSGIP
jgi:hypothetical protein